MQNNNVHSINTHREKRLTLEQNIISILLNHINDQKELKELLQICKQYITCKAFAESEQQMIFEILNSLHTRRALNIDIIIGIAVNKYGLNEDEQSLVQLYIKNLCHQLPPLGKYDCIQIENYCKQLAENYAARTMETLFINASQELSQPGADICNVRKNIIEQISDLNLPKHSNSMSLDEIYNIEKKELSKDKQIDVCINTGIKAIDDIIQGIPRKSITGLIGDTGTGKTTLAIQVACNVALENPDIDVLYFSLEMSCQEIHRKIITYMSGGTINGIKLLKRSNLSDKEREDYLCFAEWVSKMPIYIIDNLESNTIENINNEIKAHTSKHNRLISLIIIDHWHLLNFCKDKRGLNYTEAQNQDIVVLNNFIKSIDSRLLILTQRDKDSIKKNIRPTMYDVKGTTGLVQVCQNFIVLERPEIDSGDELEIAKIYLDKTRHSRGTSKNNDRSLHFNNKKVIFEDLDGETQAIINRWDPKKSKNRVK